MKAFFTCLAVSLAISAAAAATTCNHSNAQPWPSSSDGGCNGNAACEALAAEGQCNSQTLIDGGDCVKRRSTGAGGSLQCSASEMCYLYTDGDALCINWSTGAYHDETGGKGNAFSGAYTAADGSQTTNLGGTATTPSRTSTKTRIATTTGTATVTTTGAATATSPQSAASATKTGAAGDFRGDAAKAAWAVAAPMLFVLAA